MNLSVLKNKTFVSVVFAILGILAYWLGKGIFDSSILSLVGVAFWLVGVGSLAHKILVIFFKNYWLSFWTAPLLVFFLLGFVLNAFNSLWLFNYFSITIGLITVLLLLALGSWWLKEDAPTSVTKDDSKKLPLAIWLSWLALFLLGVFFWLSSLSGARVNNPWQFLSPYYLISCLALFVYNLYLIFCDKYKSGSLLLLIVLLSFLVHGYLSVSLTGFDGDRFRHLGSEYRLLNHISETNPQIRSAYWGRMVQVGPLTLPKPVTNLAQFSYSFQWTLVAFIADLLTVNAYLIDLYLGWLIWASFVPILFYAGGRLLFKEGRFVPLLLAQASLLPYLLIYNGGQTLPVAFGAIFFLLYTVLCLTVIESRDKKLVTILAVLAGLSFFSYTLSFIAVVIAWGILMSQTKSINNKRLWIFVAFGAGLIVLAEGLSGYSSFVAPVASKIYQQFFSTNILFFVNDYFYSWNLSWLSIFWKVITLGVYAILAYLFYRLIRVYKANRVFLFFLGVASVLLLSFLIGISFLDGVLATIKRLNVFLALLLVWLVGFGFAYYKNTLIKYKYPAMTCLTMIFALSFLSGPFTIFASSVNDVVVAKYLSQKIGNDWNNNCVLADIFVLLPLETFTDREIAGGNFPITFNHGQPELNSLMTRIKQSANQELLAEIFSTTKKEQCYVVLDGDTDPKVVDEMNSLVGHYQLVSNKYVWLIEKI